VGLKKYVRSQAEHRNGLPGGPERAAAHRGQKTNNS
jgi:hypothetical protein